MPPKRAKTAAKQSASRALSNPTSTRSQTTRTTRGTRAADDDDLTELVRSGTRRTSGRKNDKSSETLMTGGLGDESPTATAVGEYDAPADSGEEVQPQTKSQADGRKRPQRVVKKIVPSEAQRQAIEGLRRRMEAEKSGKTLTAELEEGAAEPVRLEEEQAQKAPPQAARSPTPPARTVPNTVPRRPASALKVQSTPGVGESSVLALANFRRRPRQPSLLQMVQQGGLGEDTTDLTFESDEDIFAPYDESTPLQVSKPAVTARVQDSDAQDLYEVSPQPAQGARPQDNEDEDLYGASPRPRTSRKRNSDEIDELDEIQVIRSSPSRSESPLSESEDGLPYNPTADLPVHDSAPDAGGVELEQQGIHSDTFADPLSSSPPPMPQAAQSQETSRRGRLPRAAEETTTKSPNRGRKTKPLSTAMLRALLPKRRVRLASSPIREARSDFDIPSSSATASGADSDQKASTTRRKPAKNAPAARQVAKKSATTKQQPRHAPLPSKVTGKTNANRTYARSHVSSDKENAGVASTSSLSELTSNAEDDDGQNSLDTIRPGKGRTRGGAGPASGKRVLSKELQDARDKFAAVDQWEMEFESASLGAGGDSSPWR